MIHLNSAIKTTAVIIRLEIVTPIQTVDDGSAGCNNYTLLLLEFWLETKIKLTSASGAVCEVNVVVVSIQSNS